MTNVIDCMFCKMATGAFPTDMLYQDSMLFAVRDIAPRAPIHVLIVPRRHIGTARDLGDEHAVLLSRMVTVGNDLASQLDIAERGYRLAINVGEEGGQTIYHLHMHLLGGAPLGPEG